jgi:lipopolysaccharide/colanic/teichoic acid biosynthesis glycosyltransferase
MSSISITPPSGEPQRASSDTMRAATSQTLPPVSRTVVVRAAKRGFDVVVSALLLLVLLPLLAIVALLVRLDSPGPVFFRCERAGYRGRSLRVLKFRKMACDASGGPLTTAEDARFTRVGRWLTKYKLDELPQIWQVLKGEMSLVGPRPEDRGFVARHAAAYHERILTVRPGIFGLSQLAFAHENGILDPADPVGHYVARILPQKVALDQMYAAHHDLRLDLRILFWSCIAVVLRRPVAVDRGSAAMRVRRRDRERT